MLSLLKKKSDAATALQVPPWHPNFRNYEKLPDIKVVRTAFFINVGAVSLALALLIYFGFEEWKLRTLNLQIADWQRQIDRDQKASDQAVALFGKFKSEEAKLLEVDAFVKSKPIVSDLVVRLAQTLPEHIALDNFDLRERGLALRVTIRGTPQTASQRAQDYLDMLKANPEFAQQFEEFAFTGSPTRNPTTGRMNAEFELRLKGAKKP